jgi:hypothetical protein
MKILVSLIVIGGISANASTFKCIEEKTGALYLVDAGKDILYTADASHGNKPTILASHAETDNLNGTKIIQWNTQTNPGLEDMMQFAVKGFWNEKAGMRRFHLLNPGSVLFDSMCSKIN